MLRSIWRITGNADAAEDVLQSSLLAIWQRIDYVTGHANPRAIALRICIDKAWEHRKNSSSIPFKINLNEVASIEPSATRRVELAESVELLLKSIESLPDQQRTAIWMRCVEQSSYEDIAEALLCTPATARKHVEKARSRLKEKIKPQITDI